MINFLIGRPGAGKSYEAVAYHVIPAIKARRKVITNLPLNVDHFALIYGEYVRELIVILKPTKENKVRFKTMDDYGDEWKHPETSVGPLYVIDECHFALRRGGTKQDVEEWFSMHRHENADVLLISQSYGKVDKNICDMVQIMYRCTKKTAWGDENSYIRKVFDGIRGAEMNVETRPYEPCFFPFYKSHTKSDSSAEAYASDVKSFWASWPVRGAMICFSLGALMFVYAAYNSFYKDDYIALVNKPDKVLNEDFKRLQAAFDEPKQKDEIVVKDYIKEVESKIVNEKPISVGMPYEGFTIAVIGNYRITKELRYLFVAQQNGQTAFDITHDEIMAAGYTVEPLNRCAAILDYNGSKWPVTCRFAQIGVATIAGN